MQDHETTKEGVFTTILELRENGIFPAESQDDNKTTELNSEVKYAEPFDNMYENSVPQPTHPPQSPRSMHSHTDSGKGTGDDTDSSLPPALPSFNLHCLPPTCTSFL